MSEVMWQRLKVYAHYKKQKEEMNPLIKAFGFDDPKLVQKQFTSSPKDLEKLTKIYQILLPFFHAMKTLFKEDRSIPSILSKEVLWDENDFTLGQIAARLLQYEKAKHYYLKASKISPENENVWNGLGLVECMLGNPVEGLSNHQKALNICEKIYGEEHSDTARSLNEIGTTYNELGKPAEGLSYCQRALAIWEQAYGKEDPLVAESLNK